MSDNLSIVQVVNKQPSRDPLIMVLVRRLVLAAMKHNMQFQAEWLPGISNVVADRLSRFQITEARKAAPWLADNPVVLLAELLPWTTPPTSNPSEKNRLRH